MRKRLTPLAGLALAAASLTGAGSAAAFTEALDHCPGEATAPAECPQETLPTLAIDTLALQPARRSVRILVATSYASNVLVYGQVGWGIKTKQGKRVRLVVGLSGGRQTVPAGRIASFRVGLPGSVLRRLRRLTPRESLRARIAASATDASGRTVVDRVVVRLAGRG